MSNSGSHLRSRSRYASAKRTDAQEAGQRDARAWVCASSLSTLCRSRTKRLQCARKTGAYEAHQKCSTMPSAYFDEPSRDSSCASYPEYRSNSGGTLRARRIAFRQTRAAGLLEWRRSVKSTTSTEYFCRKYASTDAERNPPPPDPATGASGERNRALFMALWGSQYWLQPAFQPACAA